MKRFIYVLAYHVNGAGEGCMLAFTHRAVEAENADSAYAIGSRLTHAAEADKMARMSNDYVIEVSE